MKRISESDFKKKLFKAWLFFSLSILFVVLFCCLPIIYQTPEYTELQEKEITVSSFIRFYNRGTDCYRLYTEDKKSYIVTGKFEYDELKNILVESTKATIKIHKNPLLIFPDFAEEITVNGATVVLYNDAPLPFFPFLIIGCLLTLIAVIVLICQLWWIKHLKTQQAKRNRRIEKKYKNQEVIQDLKN